MKPLSIVASVAACSLTLSSCSASIKAKTSLNKTFRNITATVCRSLQPELEQCNLRSFPPGAAEIRFKRKDGSVVLGSGSYTDKGFVTAAHVVLPMVSQQSGMSPAFDMLALRKLAKEGSIELISDLVYVPYGRSVDAVIVIKPNFQKQYAVQLKITPFENVASKIQLSAPTDQEQQDPEEFLQLKGLGATTKAGRRPYSMTAQDELQGGDSGMQLGGLYTAFANVSNRGHFSEYEAACYLPNGKNQKLSPCFEQRRNRLWYTQLIPIPDWQNERGF